MVLTFLALVVAIALGVHSLWMIGRASHSKRKLSALMQAIDYVILVLDDEGRYIEIGPTNRKLLLRPVADLIGHRVHEFFDREQADFFVDTIRRALREQNTVHVDYTLPIDGVPTWFSGAVSPISDKRVVWVGMDITERKVAEEERHRAIVEQVHEIIFTIDDGGTIQSLNPAFERMLGLPVKEWIGRSFFDLIPAARQDAARARFASGMHSDTFPLERVVVCAGDGRDMTLEVAVVKHGSGYLGSARDITENKEAERQLRDSEERFRLLARATNDAVWDLDVASGNVWRGNEYDTLFGYKRGDIGPKFAAWSALVHPDDVARVSESYSTALAAGELSWTCEYRFRRADGTYADILDRCFIVRDAQKRATRLLGAMMDNTERKQMAEQLAQAKRVSSLGRIAASIAHEFNNVLMGMEPNLEIIRKQSSEELQKPVGHVLSSVFRGKRITEEILRFTRDAAPNMQRVSLDSLIHGWAAELAPQLGPEISLSIDIQEMDLHVSVDPYQLTQVLTNLVVNARDAMPSGGTCTITVNRPPSFSTFGFGVVHTPDRYIHIQVRDTGTGMSPENLAHVFEPLFTTKQHGTGLGLAISYQIVDRHGGMMFAESEPGRGSTLHILLPAVSDASLDEIDHTPVDSAHIAPALRRVLVIEDEEAVSEGIQALFALEGVRVDIAICGAEAIPAIERFKPDAVVLDIGLPDIDGSELYVQIAARWPCLPVVFSSGHADASKLEQYLKRPTVKLLVKPYSFESLQQMIGDLVLRSPANAA